MAMAEMEDGELLAAFGDSREEALERLDGMLPDRGPSLKSLRVGEADDVFESFKERASEQDEENE